MNGLSALNLVDLKVANLCFAFQYSLYPFEDSILIQVLTILLSLVSGVIFIPYLVLFLESFFACLHRRNKSLQSPNENSPSCVILIPAHNEETGIITTLEKLTPELKPSDRILIIADNCTDSTADHIREYCKKFHFNTGLESQIQVLERTDPINKGKGFALDFGIQYLSTSPPEIVVIFDADCQFSSGSLSGLLTATKASKRPLQSVYLIDMPEMANFRQKISAFAFRFKNWVRPLGLYRFGFPCLLTGTGMAFPWSIIQKAELGTGNIVEDMKLGIDLALAGYPPLLCPDSHVGSSLPPSNQAAIQQRTRWEHGHVNSILTQAPRLLLGFVQNLPRFQALSLLALALELSVPPLSLLIGISVLLFAINLGWAVIIPTSILPSLLSFSGFLLLLLTIAITWIKFGRDVLPIQSLLLVPFYMLWKLPIYGRLILSRQRSWIRTERSSQASVK